MTGRNRLGMALIAAMALGGSSAWAADTELHAGKLQMRIESVGFRFGFTYDGKTVAAEHAESGLLFGSDPVASAEKRSCSETECTFAVMTTNGAKGEVVVRLAPHQVTIKVSEVDNRASVELRTAGLAPAYGLGDRTILHKHYDTDISGMIDDRLGTGPAQVRLMSNLVIFPQQGMAEVLIDPGLKLLHLTKAENLQGLPEAPKGVEVHYFFGDPHEIYAAFKDVRDASGYPVQMPKYPMFGVGWEAFGALGWDTTTETVEGNVDQYRKLGYPIEWAVIGSGFWPKGQPFEETTSFGLWNKDKYPDPKALVDHFHQEGVKVMLGLRIGFITNGPYSKEGVENGYFLMENGNPLVYKIGFPNSPCYILNAQNPKALAWYLGLVKKWADFGIDGYKEDLYGYGSYKLRDDKLDPINQVLMKQGVLLIERNGYLGSAGDLDRIEDFNYDQDQDRGPVNLLALAYSGLPLGYPDIVGGTFAENHFDVKETARIETYMMRNAQWAALHASMSMGQPPWKFANPKVGQIMLQATQTHERLHPYLYSQAVRFAHDGYPWSMTPLPIAFPGDAAVYGRENNVTRGYEWMIGDALLATPLYGNDYATSSTRDVYLPAGTWMDYDTGKIYQGSQTLKGFALPVEKTALFVGGTGVVVENVDKKPVLRLYPVTNASETEFWGADSTTRSKIVVKVKDWKRATVFDSTENKVVAGRWVRFAYEVPMVVGHDYEVR